VPGKRNRPTGGSNARQQCLRAARHTKCRLGGGDDFSQNGL
jgi:hypothetical protein